MNNGSRSTMLRMMTNRRDPRRKMLMNNKPSLKKLKVKRTNQQRNQARKMIRRARAKEKAKNDHHFPIFSCILSIV